MGFCMAHLNYFPSRVAGVNFCFFIAVPSGGGCWYYAKCEMLLCKIDGELNMKLWNWDGGDMLHYRRQRQLRWYHAVVFRRDYTLSRHQNIAVDDHTTLTVDRNSTNIVYIFPFYVCLCLRHRDCCSATDGNGCCHDSRHRFSKRWHFADIKNITSDDQVR